MKNACYGLVIVFFGSLNLSIYAAEPVDSSFETASFTRVSYVETQALPDGISFSSLIGMLASVDQETGIVFIQSELGLADDASIDLLNRLLKARADVDQAAANAQENIGCLGGVAIAYGEDAYPILEAMDDIDDIVSAQHLDALRVDLSLEISEKLYAWVQRHKSNVTSIKLDLKKVFEQLEYTGDATLALICHDFESRNAGVEK
jgi:hypothetical protein